MYLRNILKDVSKALQFAYTQNIAHGDVRLENVMFEIGRFGHQEPIKVNKRMGRITY